MDEVSLTELSALHAIYGVSNYVYEGTTLEETREILACAGLVPHSVFCDIGAGYGAVVLYGAALCPCGFIAVEAVGRRAAHIARVARRLGLDRVRVVEADADAVDLTRVTHVYLNNPFLGRTASAFPERLARRATPGCRVIALNNIVADFRRSGRYREIETEARLPSYRFGVFELGR
ncbi:hypothetical protein [Hoeflea olei]|uniref:DOT1 domain-containing protein n=1 Tax=Hoeflea olei TaxID=1480615 RepID=A0A1C1YRS3_9HYPH|nr:hypothetical protein [Hoeflea olei]OCW56219.1 hypothetical protein AWJ14_19175 [Hoeflea olei]